jgi:oligogalacturonide lyase
LIGDTWPSEIQTHRDAKTGRTIRQLTSSGNNVHLYFTENSFDSQRNEIIFRSDRASAENGAPEDDPIYNLYRMDLDTGQIVQITDEERSVGSVTKTPDSKLIVYSTRNQIKCLDTGTGQVTTVYEETGSYSVGAPSISLNRRYIGFCRNEKVEAPRGPNYTGFKERFYRVKDGRITLAYLDGSGSFDVFKDTHQVGHFQFCPNDSTLAT